MATKDPSWTDYAFLKSSKDDKTWKVQINSAGQFRCNCPKFIFSGKGGAVRHCKHMTWAEADRAGKISVPLPSGTADRNPMMATARGVVDQMIVAGGIEKFFKSGGQTADTKLHAMALAVLPFLAAHGQASGATVVLQQHAAEVEAMTPGGVRLITFDE